MAIQWIGPYRILRSLGAGAMGDVFLAEDPRLRRRVALKTLSGTRSKTPEARQMLVREARAAARLTHPNVAAIYDLVETDDEVHIIMEYVDGESLAALLRGGRLPVAKALNVGVDLADALAEAHAMGVIHRDLKPANVMLGPDGHAKVLDFGLATTRAVTDSDVEPGSLDGSRDERRMVGTPPYMPPETFLARPADARSDIYSLGVTLFEMLTGHRPFKGATTDALMEAVLTDSTPRVRDFDPTLPAELDAIVARAMAREPQDRFGSAAELAAALRDGDWLEDGLTASWRPQGRSRSSRGRRTSWRSGRPYTLGMAAVLLAMSTPALFRAGGSATSVAPATAVVAVLPLGNATGDPAKDHIGVGIADVLIASLAQVPGVTMISRSATLEYRERKKDVASIARELGADLVADGTVQASGDTVRVTLSLQWPRTNRVFWSRAYDGTAADLFALQNEAAAAVSDALRVTLTPEDRHRVERPPTANVEALAEAAQAQSFLERRDVKENVDRSITLYQSAIAKDRRFAGAHAGLGQAYWRKFQETKDEAWSAKAVLEATEALRLQPEDAAGHHGLAIIYLGLGRTEQALDELTRAVALQPNNDEVHNLRGQILFDTGRREAGLAELRQAIRLRPNYWSHHYATGVRYFDAGRYPEAEAAFRRVAELQPDSTRGFLMLGTVHFAAGDVPQAIADYRRAIALRPDHAAYTNLGHAFFSERRYHEAADAFEAAARLAPKSPMKFRNLGDVYERLGQPDRAKQAYSRAVELCRAELKTNPRDARAMSMLAVYEAKLGLRADGLRHAEEAVALNPQMADVRYRKAVVLALIHRPAESLVVLDEAFARGYSRHTARSDEDLASLRTRPDFRVLVADASTDVAKGGPK
jgi:tetratricopeptide (TPR) repeat protein